MFESNSDVSKVPVRRSLIKSRRIVRLRLTESRDLDSPAPNRQRHVTVTFQNLGSFA